MGNLRGSEGTSIFSPHVIIGCVFGVLVLLAILQIHRRRGRRSHRHAPLQGESSTTLRQIHRRKEDLNRFITKLQQQLHFRQEQLRQHHQLENIVSSRLETSRQKDEQWEEIIEAGKRVHGDKWDSAVGDGPTLHELMELHKDELLEYKKMADERRRLQKEQKRSTRMTKALSEKYRPTSTTEVGDNQMTKSQSQWYSPRSSASTSKMGRNGDINQLKSMQLPSAWVKPNLPLSATRLPSPVQQGVPPLNFHALQTTL